MEFEGGGGIRWDQPLCEGQGLEQVNIIKSDHLKNGDVIIAPALIHEIANRTVTYLKALIYDPP